MANKSINLPITNKYVGVIIPESACTTSETKPSIKGKF